MTAHTNAIGRVCSVVLLAFLAVPAGAALAQDTAEPDVRAILAEGRRVYEGVSSMQAGFVQTIEIPVLERSRTGSGTWYQKGRSRFKMDFTDPVGDVIVSDGEYLWLYYPSTHPGQVIRSTIDANVTGTGMIDLQGRIFTEADNYDAVWEGEEAIAGVATHRILLTPRDESPYRSVRVWIALDGHLVRKFEIVERNETVRTVVLTDPQPNEPVSDDVFEFAPPPGTDVFDG
jgi:outer membrane lipoprotein carrier protein